MGLVATRVLGDLCACDVGGQQRQKQANRLVAANGVAGRADMSVEGRQITLQHQVARRMQLLEQVLLDVGCERYVVVVWTVVCEIRARQEDVPWLHESTQSVGESLDLSRVAEASSHQRHELGVWCHGCDEDGVHLQAVLRVVGLRRPSEARDPTQRVDCCCVDAQVAERGGVGGHIARGQREAVKGGVMRRTHQEDALHRLAPELGIGLGRDCAGKAHTSVRGDEGDEWCSAGGRRLGIEEATDVGGVGRVP